MNNPAIRTGLMIAAAAIVVGLYASVFTVGQMQQALVLRFGGVRAVLNQTGTDKPGLYFKLPFFENVVLFDKRVLDLDLPVQTLLTTDRQNLEVDAFARYRITDPLRFYQSANNIPAPTRCWRASPTRPCVTCSPARPATPSCGPSAPT